MEDAPAAYKRLVDMGASPLEEIQDVGGGILIGAVRDPFGNVLGIIQNPNFKPGEAR
ncbi:MAG: VOC family protein [Candidatus Acidiferrales bacterium]